MLQGAKGGGAELKVHTCWDPGTRLDGNGQDLFSWSSLSSGQPDLVYKTKINIAKERTPKQTDFLPVGAGPESLGSRGRTSVLLVLWASARAVGPGARDPGNTTCCRR